jgi:S-DNA-T family DNA segregation ATPase FtsK/SpoIIIE
MPSSRKESSPPEPTFRPRGARVRPFLGAIALLFAILSAFAIGDYSPAQNPALHAPFNSETGNGVDQNAIGIWGFYGAHQSLLALGIGALLIPFAAVWFAYMFFFALAHKLKLVKIACILVLLISFAVFGSMIERDYLQGEIDGAVLNRFQHGLGGTAGQMIYENFLATSLGLIGSLIVFGVLGTVSFVYLLQDNLLSDLKQRMAQLMSHLATKREQWAQKRKERKGLEKVNRKARQQQVSHARKAERMKKEAAQRTEAENKAKQASEGESTFWSRLHFWKSKKEAAVAKSAKPFHPIVEGPIEEQIPDRSQGRSAFQAEKSSAAPAARAEAEESPPESAATPATPSKSGLSLLRETARASGGLRIIASEPTKKAEIKLPEKRGDYVFPPMKLLVEPQPASDEDSTEMHQQMADLLVRTLEEFGVKVTMGEVHAGPVITRYDVYPAPGVRVEKILSLDKNIALGLKALSVRILAPVPGKGCVGIEVPNRKTQPVFIRDILESEDWVNTKADIPVALGKEVSGKPLIADLTKMPHLLIAGSTGSGKTVCINAIITSLLYHASPEDVRFVMVDPKIVEMQVYNTLPHMLVPVVTDPKKVPNALKYLLNEMDRRYQTFAAVGVRNIAGYNAKMAKNKRDAADAEAKAAELDAALSPEERAAAAAAVEVPRDPDLEGEMPEKLPYIVCIVDELADLMMVAPADIETGIARLAQLARAAGIHLILATQRPSVNVITGVIKANLPSRIAFKVASKVDSRTILDTGGADQLIGKGDMLFLPPGSADLVRSQGAFVGDDEIAGIVEYVTQQNGEPLFDEQFQRTVEQGDEDGEEGGEDGDWSDDLVPDAIEVIKTSKRASTSMLQRRLKIGYNRAARIMEILEDEGIVGPENGSSPREILVPLD